jgi:hypothetical protein
MKNYDYLKKRTKKSHNHVADQIDYLEGWARAGARTGFAASIDHVIEILGLEKKRLKTSYSGKRQEQ